MSRTIRAFAAGLSGAGLALLALTRPVLAQEVWLNDANECQVFRALNEIVPLWCAERGDIPVEAAPTLKTRGLKLGFTRKDAGAGVAATPAAQEVVAVQQSNPPVRKAINARVQFDFDSFALTADARAALDRLASVLNDQLMRDKVIEIEGHADATGPDAYNLSLSEERARAVRAYLIEKHGIPGERLPVVGKGESEPYDPAHPTAAINRRVVFANLTG